jgi:ATP-dependent Lon protease
MTKRQRKPKCSAFLRAGFGNQTLSLQVTNNTSHSSNSPSGAMDNLLGIMQKWKKSIDQKQNETEKNDVKTEETEVTTAAALISMPSFCELDDSHPPSSDSLGRMTREESNYLTWSSVLNVQKLCADATEMRTSEILKGVIPLRFRVISSLLPLQMRYRINNKLERQGELAASCSEGIKYGSWVETCLSLPLGLLIVPAPLIDDLGSILRRAKAHLDSVVYGHQAVKQAILERTFSWLSNPHAIQRPLAFCGAPGNGKTTLAKYGLSVIMGRAFNFIPLGGSQDACTLVGHNYTFEGSQPGRIVECLLSSKCMNPVIYFDELDKVSNTSKGDELANILVHLTDSTQNEAFRDRYLHGLDLDVSKTLLVFSMNDLEKVPKVLLDRIQVVHMEPFSEKAQREVILSFLLPQCLKIAGAEPGSITLSAEALQLLLSRIDVSTGVRGALEVLEEIVAKVLIWRSTRSASLIFPLLPSHIITEENELLTTVIGAAAVEAVCALKQNCCKAPVCGMYT